MKKIYLKHLSQPISDTLYKSCNLILCSFTIFLLIPTLSCKKSNQSHPSLPPITEEGKNTFGCKIDGKIWVPYIPCKVNYNEAEMLYVTTPFYSTSALPIHFDLIVGSIEGGETFIDFGPKASNFFLYKTGNIIDSLYIDLVGTTYHNFIRKGGPHFFQITKLDTANKIVSGIFSFTLYSSPDINIADSIIFTEGRFDIQMGYYSRCSN